MKKKDEEIGDLMPYDMLRCNMTQHDCDENILKGSSKETIDWNII